MPKFVTFTELYCSFLITFGNVDLRKTFKIQNKRNALLLADGRPVHLSNFLSSLQYMLKNRTVERGFCVIPNYICLNFKNKIGAYLNIQLSFLKYFKTNYPN